MLGVEGVETKSGTDLRISRATHTAITAHSNRVLRTIKMGICENVPIQFVKNTNGFFQNAFLQSWEFSVSELCRKLGILLLFTADEIRAAAPD